MKASKSKSVVLLYLVGMVVLHAAILWKLRREVRKGYSDFAIFYSAGKIVERGLDSHLYNIDLQFRIQQEFAPEVQIRKAALPYNHPPFEALIFVPLARIPYFDAYLLWNLTNLLMLAVLPFVLRPHVPLLQRTSKWCFLLVALAYFPIFIALLQGQDVIMLLLLFALVYAALKKNAEFPAGCWLALGLFRFHLILPLILILCLQKKRRAILGFVSVAVALGLVSIAVVGWKGVLAYPGFVLHLEAVGGHGAIVPADMPNLRGLLVTMLARAPGVVTNSLIALLSIGLFILASSKWKISASNPTFDLGFSLVTVATVLVSYHAFAYDLSLLLFPVLLLLNHLQTTANGRGQRRFMLLGPIFVLFFSPVQMILWFRYGQLNLLALVLLAWVWGISHEISRQTQSPV
jgi:hypothetical protein